MRALAILAVAVFASAPAGAAPDAPRVLDSFDDPAPWSVVASTQVTGAIRVADGAEGKALCLDYDFHGVSGYVGIKRALPLDYPADYAFDFQLRGDSPSNTLEFKLVDASGDNVWWVQRPNRVFATAWEPVRYRKRHVSKAWGPSPEIELRHSAKLEFTLASGSGGKGSVCFDQLRFTPLTPDDGSPLQLRSTDRSGQVAVDGDAGTEWQGRYSRKPFLTLDLGNRREFGGLRLEWSPKTTERETFGYKFYDPYVSYTVELSDDGERWREQNHHTDGGVDWILLPESEARFVRIRPTQGENSRFGLREVRALPLDFSSSMNSVLATIAAESPRGQWPRGFIGEQPYWTIVGSDGGHQQALISEDGAIELGKGGPSIEPFVRIGDSLVSWADVESTQSLRDGYLPIPTVTWTHRDFTLATTAIVDSGPHSPTLRARYVLRNRSSKTSNFKFFLVLRPLQVNPPSQFLNTLGGFSPMGTISLDQQSGWSDPRRLDPQAPEAPPRWRVVMHQSAGGAMAASFAMGGVMRQVQSARVPNGRVGMGMGLAPPEFGEGAWVFDVELPPGGSREFAWSALLQAGAPAPVREFGDAEQAVASDWHRKLDAVQFKVPPQGEHMIETLRYALATMLISRTGPRLQPGTRSYARAWIRDGAMIDEALLRLGREDVAREFVRWYAPYQFKDGKVPCCVDDRGSDPVPENDSHGELIYAIAELYRYTQDKALLESSWPNVLGAVKYMDELRASERTEANRALNPAFYGLMPASISHEGYSAKAMHSYWDDFWALRGYKDAVQIAQWLGKDAEAKRLAASRDEFAADLKSSLAIATKSKQLEFIPGSAELGDFDPTSTTIALAPADAADLLPAGLLDKSFERYWAESQARADGTRAWKDYTPYELRTVGTFVRMGQPERALAMLEFFFKGQQPQGWRQWAEVVSATPRKPFFLGDIPHAWVASDYARSVLDMFAYARESDGALVLAAGIPLDWLDGEGVAIDGLRTPYGPLSYKLRRDGNSLRFELASGIRAPPGGFVLRSPDGRETRILHAPARNVLRLSQPK